MRTTVFEKNNFKKKIYRGYGKLTNRKISGDTGREKCTSVTMDDQKFLCKYTDLLFVEEQTDRTPQFIFIVYVDGLMNSK